MSMDYAYKMRKKIRECYMRGDYARSFQLGEKLTAYYKNGGGGKNMSMADDLYNMGIICSRLGKFKDGVRYLTESSRIVQAISGNGPAFAMRLCNMAICRGFMGEYEAALALHQAALDIWQDKGVNHKEFIYGLYNLANAYYDLEKYDKAIELHNKALRLHNQKDLFYVDMLNSKAYCYESAQDYFSAGSLLLQGLKLKGRLVGETGEEYLSDLLYYSQFCETASFWADAVKYYKKAVFLIKRLLGVKHPYYAGTINHLADVYFKIGETDKALHLRLRAMKLIQSSVGENHVYYANCLRKTAKIYKINGETEKALELLNKALDIKFNIIGPSSMDYIRDVLALCSIYIESGHYMKAKEVVYKTIGKSVEDGGSLPVVMKELFQIYLLLLEIVETADQYDGIPKSAWEDGLADLIKEINERLDQS